MANNIGYKGMSPKKRSGSGYNATSTHNQDLYSNINNQAAIKQSMYDNDVKSPNESDVYSSIYGDMRNSIPRDSRGMETGLSSFIAGMEDSEKIKSKKTTDEKTKKLNDFMERTSALYEDAQNRLNKEMAYDASKKKFTKDILNYSRNINKYDPQTRQMMLGSIIDKMNDETGDNDKLMSIDGVNPFIVTVKSDDGLQTYDIRDLFASDEATTNALDMMQPENALRLQEQRQMYEQSLGMKERRLSALETNTDTNASKTQHQALKTIQAQAQQSLKEVESGENFLKTGQKALSIADNYPSVFQNLNLVPWDDLQNNHDMGSVKKIITTYFAKYHPGTTQEEVDAFSELSVLIARMRLAVINGGLKNQNMFLEKTEAGAVANLFSSPTAFKNLMRESLKEGASKLENSRSIAEAFQRAAGDISPDVNMAYGRVYDRIQGNDGATQDVASSEMNNQGYTMISDPNTGQQYEVPDSQLDAYLSAGAEVVGRNK